MLLFNKAFAYLVDFGLSKLDPSTEELDNELRKFLKQTDLEEFHRRQPNSYSNDVSANSDELNIFSESTTSTESSMNSSASSSSSANSNVGQK